MISRIQWLGACIEKRLISVIMTYAETRSVPNGSPRAVQTSCLVTSCHATLAGEAHRSYNRAIYDRLGITMLGNRGTRGLRDRDIAREMDLALYRPSSPFKLSVCGAYGPDDRAIIRRGRGLYRGWISHQTDRHRHSGSTLVGLVGLVFLEPSP